MRYSYRHKACGKVREVDAPMGEAPETVVCPRCYKQDRDDHAMTRFYEPVAFIMRPSGYSLRPGDKGFSDFRRELELGELKTPDPGSMEYRHYSEPQESALVEPEMPRIPDKQMRDIVQFGEIFDREVRNSDWVHPDWAHYDREG